MSGHQYKRRAPRWKRKLVANIPGHTNEVETAKQLAVGVRTLRKWRQQGIGPPYVKFGRQVHYPDAGRATWLKHQEVQPVRSEQRELATA